MLVLWLLLVVVGGGAMLWSTIKTQVVDGDMWREKAKAREFTERIEPARRGTIFSSDGKVLATTVPVCDLCLDLGRWPKKDSKGAPVVKNGVVEMESCITNDSAFLANLVHVCKILHEQFPHKSVAYYHDRILNEYKKQRPVRCLYVEHRVPYSQWSAIRNMKGWERCVVTKTADGSVTSYVRAHIYGNLGENTIGLHFKTPKQEGYTGLEGYYDTVLRGQDGIYKCRRLTRGIWLPEEEVEEYIPDLDSTLMQRRVDGKSIISTLDTRYQDIAESALRKSMNQYGGQRGCAILMEVSTGYVLACSSLTRDTSGRLSENLWSNVAVSDHYEPGSTFKTVAMTAMLNDKEIALDTTKRVRAGGKKRFSSTSGEINDGHGYATDTTNLAGVLAKSSNVGMCELAWEYYRTRREDLKKGIQSIFPFGKMHPDVEVLETNTGIVNLNSDRDFLNLSYGYSATVTPLQLITFYNGIANGGRMMKPLFCREVLDGRRRSEIKPVVLNEHICSEETAKQMREMLVGVVENGTGNNIYNTIYGIGGKTGTTQGIVDKSIKNSSFVGFFPADNPRYTCIVSIKKSGLLASGGGMSGVVFHHIAEGVMAQHLKRSVDDARDTASVFIPDVKNGDILAANNVLKDLGMKANHDWGGSYVEGNPVWGIAQKDGKNISLTHVKSAKNTIPNVIGMGASDAVYLLESTGVKARLRGRGKVKSQSIHAGTIAKQGMVCELILEY